MMLFVPFTIAGRTTKFLTRFMLVHSFLGFKKHMKSSTSMLYLICTQLFYYINILRFVPPVTRLMGSSGGGMNMNVSNMSSLSACSMGPDTKPMQFPMSQRRKRRVLFTQAQVRISEQRTPIIMSRMLRFDVAAC